MSMTELLFRCDEAVVVRYPVVVDVVKAMIVIESCARKG